MFGFDVPRGKSPLVKVSIHVILNRRICDGCNRAFKFFKLFSKLVFDIYRKNEKVYL